MKALFHILQRQSNFTDYLHQILVSWRSDVSIAECIRDILPL